ncbi:DUF418 domain-containing protein [Nocardiopsis sediminis]|uniref:DUF418 domain-containing protein n=1 Tax=Nocardiopsis sediminis TaxID=1778267 RepID=A0ABV8FK90_9ACTN
MTGSSDPAPRTWPGPGPTSLGRRALAPDLARGFMLLFIALVNAQFFLTVPDIVSSVADQVVVVVQSTVVNARAIPLFSLLFGYGMVQLLRRLDAGGGRPLGVLRRRGVWMAAIGLAHGALLLPVDIIGAYGLAVLLFAGLLRARDATLLWVSAAFAAASIGLHTALMMLFTASGNDASVAAGSLVQGDPVAATAERFQEWILYTPVTLLTVVVPPLLWGVWAARRRILDDPARHRRLLGWAAAAGLGIAVLGGLPDALVRAELWTGVPLQTAGLLAVLHDTTGWASGVGWAALIGLVAIRAAERRGPVVRAVEAVGQRSMTCYLLQSVAFTAAFAPYGAGLGATQGAAVAAAIGVATWGATVLVAEAMRRRGHRGPAEILLRRLTYGRPSPAA